jgi:hypothetical protein
MKTLFIVLSFIFVIFGFSQKLPNIVDVHIDNFDQIQNFNDTIFKIAIANPDTVSNEVTDCNYTLDFKNNRCMLFFEGQMIADVAILDINQNSYEYTITLDDTAIDTKIILNLENKEFIYYYRLIFGYVITKPTKYTMVSF